MGHPVRFYFFILKYFIFLGEKKLKSVLSDSTSSSTILRKAVVPKKRYSSSSNSRSRGSRDRSRSPARKDDRSDDRQSSSRKRKGSDSRGKWPGKSSNKKPKQDLKKKKDKDKGTDTLTFSSPLSNIITPAVLMLFTTLGFVLDHIPTLSSIPLGGRIRHFVDNWKLINCSDWVLNVVEFGYSIPLREIPKQKHLPKNPKATGSAFDVLVEEALQLKSKGAVKAVTSCDGQYISSYFAVPKPRRVDQFRPILNLKYFNDFVSKYKFSMESLTSVRDWIQPGYFACSLDLKDAFLHIAMNNDSKKYLRFRWLDELLEWQALVFGLTCSPRVITKVIKPVIAFLRATWNILISIYIDDLLLQARTYEECVYHTQIVIVLFMALGWEFKWQKCTLIPSQQFVHLGFQFDTNLMTISVPTEKVKRLVSLCSDIYQQKSSSVLMLEKIIGTMESNRPAVPLAAMHYRSLQKQLIVAKRFGRDPDKIIFLSQKSLTELSWWINPLGFAANATAPIREPKQTLDIWSDANTVRGGAHCSRGKFHQRNWTEKELSLDPHINLLELRAAKESLFLAQPGDIIRLHLDSQVAAAYIRHQGGTKSQILSDEACLLWKEAVSRKVTLLTPHWLSSKDNAMADFLTRHTLPQWEFQLLPETFCFILDHFHVSPTLDAFSSRATAQLDRYMTWYPDSQAVARDALIHPWDPVTYLFPPVPMILKCLKKVMTEKIEVVMVLPQWPSALWWPLVQNMLVNPPLSLPSYRSVLEMVDSSQELPYMNPLVAVHIQGN